MKQTKLILIIGIVTILILACATIGGGGNQNNTNQANNSQNQEQDNTQDLPDEANQPADNDQSQNQGEGTGSDTPDSSPEADSELDAALWETEFGKLLASGDLAVEGIQANSEDSDTVGTILTVQFVNLGNDEIIVSLPCGLVFIPSETDEQALMMIQPLEITLAVGETAEFTPYVVCIELAAPAPAYTSTYTIGYLESDQLLAFAECVCGEEIDDFVGSMDPLGVQFAAWTVATQGDFTGLIEDEAAAAGEFLEGIEGSEAVTAMFEMMSTFSSEWLDRCGFTFDIQ